LIIFAIAERHDQVARDWDTRWHGSALVALHEQLIASVQDATLGDHEYRRLSGSLTIGDDLGFVVFARASEYDDELGFGSVLATIRRPSRSYGSTMAWPIAARTANTACEARTASGSR
jgi:hypothetical protein